MPRGGHFFARGSGGFQISRSMAFPNLNPVARRVRDGSRDSGIHGRHAAVDLGPRKEPQGHFAV